MDISPLQPGKLTIHTAQEPDNGGLTGLDSNLALYARAA
jgi:hypothetical protein